MGIFREAIEFGITCCAERPLFMKKLRNYPCTFKGVCDRVIKGYKLKNEE